MGPSDGEECARSRHRGLATGSNRPEALIASVSLQSALVRDRMGLGIERGARHGEPVGL